ncbi:MAG: hypothetical protein KY475_23030 [Planctomycetes bacterium]|nr:hypothetical protein [Planctomycetota bacterium]
MRTVTMTREAFLEDRLGKAFTDVAGDSAQPFDEALQFFSDERRQQRMEEAEIHHDRPPLAGVVREFESQPAIDRFFREIHPRQSKRFRQAVGALVRLIMEGRGWKKTGRKGSLGVRAAKDSQVPNHNTGGLAFWFLRAERYEPASGMQFQSVRERCGQLESGASPAASGARRGRTNGQSKDSAATAKRRRPRSPARESS